MAKKKELGTFSAYGMEDVFDFLTEERVKQKDLELRDKPTLVTSFSDFISRECVSSTGGEFHFFFMMLIYFPNDLDLVKYLFKKSKSYSEANYPVKASLKEMWVRHLESMDRLIKKRPEDALSLESSKRSYYWLEYSLFYKALLSRLLTFFNQQKLSSLRLVGEFKRKGSLIFDPEFEIVYRAHPKPKTGYSLTIKSELLLENVKIELIEGSNGFSRFKTIFKSYQIEFSKENVKITELELFSNEQIRQIKETDFLTLIGEVIDNYIKNFEKISHRYTNDVNKGRYDTFLGYALNYKDLDDFRLSQIEKILIDKSELWGSISEYRNTKFMGL
jgi:hypothetical protein